jgi:hypothetical protein
LREARPALFEIREGILKCLKKFREQKWLSGDGSTETGQAASFLYSSRPLRLKVAGR